MKTVVPSDSIDEIKLKIDVVENGPKESIEYLPYNDKSGLIIISSTPYSRIDLRIPSEAALTNQYGEEAALRDLQLISGQEEQSDLMEVVSPGSCNELIIPETGHIYIRVGGTLQSEKSLRGIYSGTLNLDCLDE